MRPLLLLFILLMAGCAGPDPATTACRDIETRSTVEQVDGDRFLVDNGSLWIGARSATVLLRSDGACTPIAASEVHVDDHIGHDAERIATSYPAQASPEHVVIERP